MATTEHGRRASLTIRTMAVLCLALVCAATTLQAAHVCGAAALDAKANNGTTVGAVDPGSVICLSCITAHSTTPVAIITTPMPASDAGSPCSIAQPVRKSAQDTFALYVRPPPLS